MIAHSFVHVLWRQPCLFDSILFHSYLGSQLKGKCSLLSSLKDGISHSDMSNTGYKHWYEKESPGCVLWLHCMLVHQGCCGFRNWILHLKAWHYKLKNKIQECIYFGSGPQSGVLDLSCISVKTPGWGLNPRLRNCLFLFCLATSSILLWVHFQK